MSYRFVIIIFFIFHCNPEIGPPNHRLLPLIGIENNSTTNTNNTNATGTPSTTTSNPDAVNAPVFSPSQGHISTPTQITLSTTTTGATIYYTIDGSTPTSSSTVYNTSIGHVWALAGRTIKAITIKGGVSSSVTTAEYTSPNVKTGQTICYDPATNVATPCSGSKQDGELQIGLARGYIDNGDDTITDTGTGLIWQRCPRGRSGVNCGTGSSTTGDRPTQENYCNTLTLAGKVWRLPSRSELLTLVDYSTIAPTINSIFQNNGSTSFRTTTTYQQNITQSYTVTFNSAETGNTMNSSTIHSARCVSGLTRLPASYVDNFDGTGKDKVSGLVWQKCNIGEIDDATCTNTPANRIWSVALNDCNTLPLAGRTWRLPNQLELESLIDLTRTVAPLINDSIFSVTTPTVLYWTSTTDNVTPARAFTTSFNSGNLFHFVKSDPYRVRCVSDP